MGIALSVDVWMFFLINGYLVYRRIYFYQNNWLECNWFLSIQDAMEPLHGNNDDEENGVKRKDLIFFLHYFECMKEMCLTYFTCLYWAVFACGCSILYIYSFHWFISSYWVYRSVTCLIVLLLNNCHICAKMSFKKIIRFRTCLWLWRWSDTTILTCPPPHAIHSFEAVRFLVRLLAREWDIIWQNRVTAREFANKI